MFSIVLDAGTPATLASMIRRAFGPGAAKRAAPYADVSDRTVSDWLQRRSEPGAWRLLRMVRHPEFRAELRSYLDHIECEEAKIALKLDNLAAQRLRMGVGNAGVHGKPLRTAAVRATAQGQGVQRRGVKSV